VGQGRAEYKACRTARREPRWCDHSRARGVRLGVAGRRTAAVTTGHGFGAGCLNADAARNTLERVAGLDRTWGGSFHMNLGFKDRGRLLPSVRNLVFDVCREYIDSCDTISQLVTAVQELLENLVKYSEAGAAALDFELLLLDGQPSVRIGTVNRASDAHLCEAERILERIVSTADPLELFHSLVASSGERKGSGLGLVRLRAEAGLALSYMVQHGRLSIEARRTVQPRQPDGRRGAA
jgi:hypothetical protein